MEDKKKDTLLLSGFINSASVFADRVALEVREQSYTYSELERISKKIAKCISLYSKRDNPFAAILGYRSISAYSGIIGTLFSGKGYMPLNIKFPLERSYAMLNISGADTLIVGNECFTYFNSLLEKIKSPILAIFPDKSEDTALKAAFPQHQFVFSEELNSINESAVLPEIKDDSIAYLLFTSGSTGIPKGVPVSHKNVTSYIHYISTKYDFKETDKFSQTFDLTFDLSVHDLFLSWSSGACLCIPSDESMLSIAQYIREKKITVWFSVPSVAILLSKMRLLKKESFSTLKYSLFCGEALSEKTAEEWQNAAPSSTLVNLYGPTETTISIARYEWKKNTGANTCSNGIVPIGKVFETHQFCIVNENLEPVKQGESGELCINGPQVTAGYFNDIENTSKNFIHIQSKGNDVWYRTGDVVREEAEGNICFLGRLDSQIKIQGYRIDLLEIDYTIKKLTNIDQVITLPIKNSNGEINKLTTFICSHGKQVDTGVILDYCRQVLPAYMMPGEIRLVKNMPLNANGKIDKKTLLEAYLKENSV
jgi:amino acid adenylation domain-containing protein